jgi:iron complex outermembrane receptor protein
MSAAPCALFAFGLGLPMPAHAQSAGGNQMEEIIVTARRVEERLEAVPISISVFNQRQLTDRNIISAADLATYTPSLSVNNQFGNESTAFALRGFSQDIGTAATVGVYFADVVAPRGGLGGLQIHAGDGAGPGSFFDLQNVQVLKGPQGTLFGRNTTGGAVLLVPQKPTPDFGGYFEAGGGNYSMEHLQGVVNLPVNEKIRLRAGFDQQTRDGYINNISGVGPKDFNNIDYVAGRLSLVVDVTDDIENYTVASFTRSDTNGPLEQIFACVVPSQGISGPVLFGPMACNQIAREQGHGPYVAENDLASPGSYLRQWQVINTTTWNVSDDVTIKNIASYAQLTSTLKTDLFGDNWFLGNKVGPFPVPAAGVGKHLFFLTSDVPAGIPTADQSTVTEELQAHGDALDGKLRWQAGLYWEGSFPLGPGGSRGPSLITCTDYQTLQCYAPLGFLTIGEVQQNVGEITYRDYAAYGQATYSILDNLKFTAGLRVTDDSTTGQMAKDQWKFTAPPYTVPAHSCVFSSLDPANCLLSLHTSSRAPTWVMDLDYTPVEDLMVYFKYARGYRTGGIGPNSPPGFQTYQPEQVDTYEFGTKTSFRGDVSGFINFAAFYNDFSDQQVPAGFQSSKNQAPPTQGIINTGASRIYGFELESAIVPYRGVTLDLSYTYLNSRLSSVKRLAPLPGSPYDEIVATAIAGYPLQFTPRNKLSFTAAYRLPVDDAVGKITLSTTYTYTGDQLTSSAGPFQVIPAFDLLNLNVNWEGIYGSPVDAEFFMTNATDNVYASNLTDLTSFTGFASRIMGEPRMFGGRLRYHFGGPG